MAGVINLILDPDLKQLYKAGLQDLACEIQAIRLQRTADEKLDSLADRLDKIETALSRLQGTSVVQPAEEITVELGTPTLK
jgi:hypothetical protein